MIDRADPQLLQKENIKTVAPLNKDQIISVIIVFFTLKTF